MIKRILFGLLLFILSCSIANAFEQRFVNIGITSFLDGLPLPGGKGFSYFGHWTHYNAELFRNENGDPLPVQAENNALLTQILYQSDVGIFSGKFGTDLLVIYVTNIDVPPNPLNLTSGGSGFDDLVWGGFLQWDTIMVHGRPVMANRIELQIYFPTGKFDNRFSLNPGAHHYSYEPYWAATVFILPRWTLTWRLHYLFNGKNQISGITPGDAFHANFATSFAIIPHRFRLGAAAYYFKQVDDSTINGQVIPNSKEQVLAIGPGFLLSFSKTVHFFCNSYFERDVKNRSDGTRIVFGLLAKL